LICLVEDSNFEQKRGGYRFGESKVWLRQRAPAVQSSACGELRVHVERKD